MVRGEGTATFPYCHTYLFKSDILIVFDPQCGRNRLQEALQELGCDFEAINFIINSHFHLDHTGSNEFLRQKSNAQIWIHEADRPALENFDEFIKRYGMTDKNLESEWRKFLRNFGLKEVKPDKTFQDGDILPGGFKVIHTPGHAPGHCCFYKSSILIAGDIDLVSPWVGNRSCSIVDYLKSLEKLKQLPIKALFPSHNEPIYENIAEQIDLFRQRFIKHADRIFNLITEAPLSLDQITELAFQSLPETKRERLQTRQIQFRSHFGKISTLNYLIYLESLGKIKKNIQNETLYWQKTI
jgi:glyoxylase-like metal-dependent hydrolase (beta-lactamase superfamily II)